ncbi:MAG: FAD-binding oxidoreductase [Pseudomonadota bacterium]
MADFPFATLGPAEHVGPLPDIADVAIVGGGVMGVCAALFLARKGVSVVLVEKGRIAAEQSARNWGWIRQQGRDPAEITIMAEAQRHWQALSRETNDQIGLTQTGVAYLATSEAEQERFEGWLPNAKAHGIGTRALSRAEVQAMMPDAQADWVGGIYTDTDMKAEPWVAVPALARLAVRDGAVLCEGIAARGIETSAGRVSALITEAGRLRCSEVIVAGGAWSSLFLRNVGVNIPQLSVRASVVAVDAAPMAYAGAATDDKVAFRPRADGGYTLACGGARDLFVGPDAFRAFPKYLKQLAADPFGTKLRRASPKGFPDGWRTPRRWALDEPSPFERMRVLNPAPNDDLLARVTRDFAARFPDLGPVRPKAKWAGMIDTMPDIVPIVDRVDTVPGLTVATGLSGHGFGIGPGMGRVVSDLVTGDAVGHDLHRFRFSRFSDGSPIVIDPTSRL